MNKRLWIVFIVLALASLACGNPAPEYVLRGWTVTPRMFEQTQTPSVRVITTTPLPTSTPVYVEITNTPKPTNEPASLCVTANEAVYLRPSPSVDNYPIREIPNGALVLDLGGRDGSWYFVQYEDKQGWINGDYLTQCHQGGASFMYVSNDVVSLNILPNGNIGSVGMVTVCDDVAVYGSPRTDVPVVGELKAGDVILSHEIYQDWMMYEPAKWIPLGSICEFQNGE